MFYILALDRPTPCRAQFEWQLLSLIRSRYGVFSATEIKQNGTMIFGDCIRLCGRDHGLAVALIDGVGDWISVLIVRDALAGLREPAEFQRSLGAPQDVIADRLHALVDLGILAQRTPPEHLGAGYVLKDKGNELLGSCTSRRWTTRRSPVPLRLCSSNPNSHPRVYRDAAFPVWDATSSFMRAASYSSNSLKSSTEGSVIVSP